MTTTSVAPIHREPELLGQTVVLIGGSTGPWGLQARDEFGHDLRGWLWLFDEPNALSGPQR